MHPNALKRADALATKLVAWMTGIDHLIDQYRRYGYRPTLRADLSAEHTELADLYDARAAERGLTVRALRG